MKEIGSEFWTSYPCAPVGNTDNERCLMSGRTALRFIIDDICKTGTIRKALLPSYCCESMIIPFVHLGIDVQFYEVTQNGVYYPYDNDADVILLIDFFGYKNSQNSVIAQLEKQEGKVIIYDATHKLDGNPDVQKYADYSFCSYRKWFFCNFATAVKHNGAFVNNKALPFNQRYVAMREDAARAKERYFAESNGYKEEFLAKFSSAERILEDDYAGYAGVPVTFDCQKIISKRKENALYLTENLKNIRGVKLWCDDIQIEDAPMFVPILVDPLIRNDLRQRLIDEKIYCPIHWPKSAYHRECNELYDTELSLVCDQRYDASDMERMVRVITDFFNG